MVVPPASSTAGSSCAVAGGCGNCLGAVFAESHRAASDALGFQLLAACSGSQGFLVNALLATRSTRRGLFSGWALAVNGFVVEAKVPEMTTDLGEVRIQYTCCLLPLAPPTVVSREDQRGAVRAAHRHRDALAALGLLVDCGRRKLVPAP